MVTGNCNLPVEAYVPLRQLSFPLRTFNNMAGVGGRGEWRMSSRGEMAREREGDEMAREGDGMAREGNDGERERGR